MDCWILWEGKLIQHEGVCKVTGNFRIRQCRGHRVYFFSTRSQSFALKSEASRDENLFDTSSVSIAWNKQSSVAAVAEYFFRHCPRTKQLSSGGSYHLQKAPTFSSSCLETVLLRVSEAQVMPQCHVMVFWFRRMYNDNEIPRNECKTQLLWKKKKCFFPKIQLDSVKFKIYIAGFSAAHQLSVLRGSSIWVMFRGMLRITIATMGWDSHQVGHRVGRKARG